jgi:hypothetical protein
MQLTIDLQDTFEKDILDYSDFKNFVQEQVVKLVIEYKNQKRVQSLDTEIKTPITDSLVGIIKGSNLDESDYKKHLEEKYL